MNSTIKHGYDDEAAERNKEAIKEAIGATKKPLPSAWELRKQAGAKRKEKAKVYREKEANREKARAYGKAYRKKDWTEQRLVDHWKYQGIRLKGDGTREGTRGPERNWGACYKKHIMTINCESCNVELNPTLLATKRCLNFDPYNGNHPRGTICHTCNKKESWKTRMTPDSIFQKYI
jgi:hypothetical protein